MSGAVTAWYRRQQDKQNIQASLPHRLDLTLLYMELPPDSIASELCRHDEVLAWRTPHDADTLVRKDLRSLWNTDLEGHPIAAARDVVIAKVSLWGILQFRCIIARPREIRAVLPEFEKLCFEMKDARY
ncbi:hypothetical protein OG21DRAFT_1501188 [Imleria badia]|nr:hypothetical protein OG21DRAFT_1501188 [Imleria badia]